jgi:hypothetical protein
MNERAASTSRATFFARTSMRIRRIGPASHLISILLASSLAAVLALATDVPEFRYVMPDGTATDFTGWKQGHTEYFATVAAHRFAMKRQHFTVLAQVPDTEWLEYRLKADDWLYTDADGKVTAKAQDLADAGFVTYQATDFKMSNLKVRIYGDTAVVTGRQTEVATMAGKDASAVFRVTDVWRRRDGRWQAIASHLSREAASP